VRYRIAAATGWGCDFKLTWDKTVVSRGEMEAAVIDAGRLCGIGDGRSVGFGRFEVTNFEVAEG
jgi:CRISPR/Cas system endoribonuclease Cas6 (RAMP superfamily)